MAKIIGTFEDLLSAQAAANSLVASGVERDRLSIIGRGSLPEHKPTRLKTSVFWGSALGAAVALALPHGGIIYLAGHLARAAAWHVLGVTVKGMLVGAAAGGTMDVLRRAGLDRRAAQHAAEIIKSGRVALALDGDWTAVQRARHALSHAQPQPDACLLEMVRRYGYEHQSFLSLYGGMEVWKCAEPEAAVLYRRVGRVVVVTAAPLAPLDRMDVVLRNFLNFCDAEKLDCLMLPVGSENAKVAQAVGMGLIRIGESGYFNLKEWKPAGDRCKKVRAGVNQARRAGIRVERFLPQTDSDARTRREIEVLCQEWVDTREVDELGWLLELDPFRLNEHKRYFLARGADGKLVGLLACCPIFARRGWYLEDLIRKPGADRGVSELLVTEALKHLAEEGAEIATLGTSPLAGIEPTGKFKNSARFLRFIYEHLDAFYHFKALHRFKAKFAPSFVDPEYVAIYPPRIRLRMGLALVGVFDPNGLTGVVASKLRRLWREARKSEPSRRPISIVETYEAHQPD